MGDVKKKYSFKELYGSNVMKYCPRMNYPKQNPTQDYPNDDFENDLVRHNLQHLSVHTIDPIGSKDADDAFSIETVSPRRTFLYVHICDPTSWIKSVNSECFKCAGDNGTCYYPSGQRTRRMFNASIRNLSSMRKGRRNAFSFRFEFSHPFNSPTEDPCHSLLGGDQFRLDDVALLLSSVRCCEKNEHTYESASIKLLNKSPFFVLAGKLTDVLKQTLSSPDESITGTPVVFGKMEYLYLSSPKLMRPHGRVMLCRDSSCKIKVKRLIAIMATAANGVVANMVELLANDLGCYIDRSISLYTHFTSPLRRFSDCMLHFEMKRLMHKSGHLSGLLLSDVNRYPDGKKIQGSTFPPERLELLIQNSKKALLQQQILHQRSIQFRCMQYIYQRLKMDGARRVRTRFTIGSTKTKYIKIYFLMIDGHDVRVQHVVRANKTFSPGQIFEKEITQCNKPYNHFNDGVLPQIEEMFWDQTNASDLLTEESPKDEQEI